MVVASAPGKVMLFGEYAVLAGAPALVAAVQRRAVCTFTPGETLVVEGRSHGTRHWPGQPGDVALPFAEALFHGMVPRPGRYVLDSSALQAEVGGTKLGLGSSAASTVALLAAAAQTTDPNYLYPVAFSAHRAAQGSGSGADVAAAAHGGVIRYQLGGDEAPADIRPYALGRSQIWTVWTGQAASTAALVGAVQAISGTEAYRVHMNRLRLVAEGIDEGADFRELASQAFAGLEALGEAAGVELVTEVHRHLRERVKDFGGYIKPTGAGGGDLAWIVGDSEDHEAHMARVLAQEGHPVLGLPIDPAGAQLAKVPVEPLGGPPP